MISSGNLIFISRAHTPLFRHTVRFTFTSPSTLIALLPQATIPITTIPQLVQLLGDEIERGLLEEICEIGIEVCQSLSGTWFVDEMMCRAVGRWEGCVLYVTLLRPF